MNGLNDSYVESVIKKAISGRLTPGQAAAKIPPKTVVDIYVTRSGKRVAAFGGRIWALVEVEKKASGAETKARGQAEVRTRPEPSVEKIRFKSEERLETNHWIMTHSL